jgi:hypothetical protein
MSDQTDDALIAEYIRLDDFCKAETKRFGEHLAPRKARMEEIQNQLLALLNQRGADSTATDTGTAYKSHILNTKVEDREALLDWINEHWDDGGGEMLIISPQKDAVKNFMDAHEGRPPPGVSTSWFTRINIRRS